jgi:hypothetical protein
LESISEIPQKALKRVIFIRRNFQRCKDSAEIGSMIPVMEKTYIPSAAQRVQELKQRARAFGKLETAESLAFDISGMTTDHIAHMQLRKLVVREVGCFVTLPQKFGLNSRGIIAAADTQAYEYIGFFPLIESVIEFGDDTPPQSRAKLTK